jgi:hypothetical protein
MATTVANTTNVNNVEPAKVSIVNTLPSLAEAELGEVYLLISDGDTDDKKLHIRYVDGWLKTDALS